MDYAEKYCRQNINKNIIYHAKSSYRDITDEIIDAVLNNTYYITTKYTTLNNALRGQSKNTVYHNRYIYVCCFYNFQVQGMFVYELNKSNLYFIKFYDFIKLRIFK